MSSPNDVGCLAPVAALVSLTDIEDGETGCSYRASRVLSSVTEVYGGSVGVCGVLPRHRSGRRCAGHKAGNSGIVAYVHGGARTSCYGGYICNNRIGVISTFATR